ncbi:glycosyltransferase [Flaviramulus aquimarinus]|uniref:Glycosyltransferase n=1 Tax=Flaviramulus aquimarinus TaxID=1170456 RepID=A0ABP9EN65_9FLAO
MAHIGLIITGLTGRLNSSFQMATKLQNEGHTITYLCPKDVKKKVESLGFIYIQLPPINLEYKHDDLEKIQSSSWFSRCKYHYKNYFKHYKIGKKILNLNEYEIALKKLNPDHFIIDMEMHDLIFTAYKLKIPVTLFTAWFSNKMGLGIKLPPLRTDIIPGKKLKGSSIGILINWLFIKLKVQARIFVNKLTFKDYRRQVLKKYAKNTNFPTRTLIASNLPYLFCYTNLPILSFTLSEMDFPHRSAKNHIYVGPMIYEQRDAKFDANSNKIIDEIIQLKQKAEKKLIYFSAGSILVPEVDFIKKVMKAIENKKDWLLIVSLGKKLTIDTFQSQSNCFFIPWVPQLKVLKHTDCCITHAGINTISECIHYAVPMLVYSGNEADENGNAARIDYHKLGVMRNKQDTPKEINEQLDKILNNQSFKNNLNIFNGIYNKYQQRNLSDFLKIKL